MKYKEIAYRLAQILNMVWGDPCVMRRKSLNIEVEKLLKELKNKNGGSL